MPIKAPKSSPVYDLVPAGNHVARVYRVIHIGTIPEMYMGEEKMMNKVMIGFELLNEKKVFKQEKGEEPYVISAEYTLSMNSKANLRKLIEGMYGVNLRDDEAEAFDALSIVGSACLLNVVHKTSASGNVYALVKGASPLPRGMVSPAAYNPVQTLDYDDWSKEVFNNLPQFLKDKVTQSLEYKTKFFGGIDYPKDDVNPEDIPF